MKLAIGLYGHYRTMPAANPSWADFYKRYNPDIFVHSWTDKGHKAADGPVGTISLTSGKVTKDSFYDILGDRLKDIQVDEYSDYKDRFDEEIIPIVEYQQTCPAVHHGITVHSRYSQAYKVEQTDKLRQQSNVDYDIVLLTRPDVLLTDASATLRELESSQVAIAEFPGQRMIMDLVRYAHADTMTKVSSLYTHYHEMVEIGKANDDPHICFDTHGMVYAFIAEYHKLEIVPTNIPVTMQRGE